MKIQTTVEDVITSFPHPILPIVQGDPEYHTIHAILKLLQANARSINTHPGGGGSLGHMGLIVSVTVYAVDTADTAETADMSWQDPPNPGRGKTLVEGAKSHQINAVQHQWEEDYNTFKPFAM
jgi:hypothetical protein